MRDTDKHKIVSRPTSVAGDAASPPASEGEARINGLALEGSTPHPQRVQRQGEGQSKLICASLKTMHDERRFRVVWSLQGSRVLERSEIQLRLDFGSRVVLCYNEVTNF